MDLRSASDLLETEDLDPASLTRGQYLTLVQAPKPPAPEPADVADPAPADPAKAWMAAANCLGVDPDLFFPERGEPTDEAKAVCRACSVREPCLEYALANGETLGIWGGTAGRERQLIRRARRRAAREQAAS